MTDRTPGAVSSDLRTFDDSTAIIEATLGKKPLGAREQLGPNSKELMPLDSMFYIGQQVVVHREAKPVNEFCWKIGKWVPGTVVSFVNGVRLVGVSMSDSGTTEYFEPYRITFYANQSNKEQVSWDHEKPTVSPEDTSEARFAAALAATTASEVPPETVTRAAPGVGHDGKADQGKLRWSLLPWRGAECVVRVMEHGAKKYGPHTWQTVPNGIERYREALLRHMTALMMGEEVDEESGLPHIWHVATNALFVAELEWKQVDDILNCR